MDLDVPPFAVVLELVRGEDAGEAAEHHLRDHEYVRRNELGTPVSARFPWTEQFERDLAALRRWDAGSEVAKRVGLHLRRFLRALSWEAQEDAIKAALAAGCEVHLTVRTSAAEIWALPWDLLTLAGSDAHFGTMRGCHVQYEWPGALVAPPTVAPAPEGGVLLFGWSAAGGEVPNQEQLRAIQKVCTDHQFPSPVELPALDLSALDAALGRLKAGRPAQPVAVLHLLCHGSRGPEREPRYGLMLNASGYPEEVEWVDPSALQRVLAPYVGLIRMVVLSACSSGNMGDETNALGSVAQALHRLGIPAVVSSLFPLSWEGSIVLTHELYQGLLDGTPLHRVLERVRRHLGHVMRGLDWATLQLCARADDSACLYPIVFRPYCGLAAFDQENRRFFFGREALREELCQRLHAALTGELPRFQLLAGASGCGKSSLVMAGAVPALAEAGWRVERFRPSDAGVAEQVAALMGARTAVPTLLVIDQMEELFTHLSQEAREALVRALWGLSRIDGEPWMVLGVMRVDFLASCGGLLLEGGDLRFDSVFYDEQHRLFVSELSPREREAAIRSPAGLVGISLEAGLLEEIQQDISRQSGGLPLLEHALGELWRQRDGTVLTRLAYRQMGGVTGALQRRAQGWFDALTEEDQQMVRALFLRLMSFGEGVADTRRRAPRAELYSIQVERERIDQMLHELSGEDLRLVVANEDTVEVAHEVLIQEWSVLREWVAGRRSELHVHRRLTEAAREWVRHEREPGFLWQGAQLRQAEAALRPNEGWLNVEELQFLEGSCQQREAQVRGEEARHRHELDEARRMAELQQERATEAERREVEQRIATKRLRSRNGALGVAAIVASVLALVAMFARRVASTRSEEMVAMNLAAHAMKVLPGDPRLALLLAREAWCHAEIPAASAAFDAWLKQPGLLILAGHNKPILVVGFSRDGARVLTGSRDGTVRIWDARTGRQLHQLSGTGTAVRAATFSPDGSKVASAGVDKILRVWDSVTGMLVMALTEHSGEIFSIAYSSDGRWMLTASADGTARVWDARTGRVISVLLHGSIVRSAVFSGDDARVVTTGKNEVVKIWNPGTGELLLTLPGHAGLVYRGAFSNDGLRLVTASRDNTARLWDARTGEVIAVLKHQGPVRVANFSPDGKWIVTASEDGRARVWNGQRGELIVELPQHSKGVTDASFSSDGQRLVTCSLDRTARVLETVKWRQIAGLTGHTQAVNAAAFSPDGMRMITVSDDRSARMWEPATGRPDIQLRGHGDLVRTGSFSLDGRWVFTTSHDHTAQLWDATMGVPVLTFETLPGGVTSAALSHDHRKVVTVSAEGAASIWNTQTGAQQSISTGHTERVQGVTFSANDQWIMTWGQDGATRIFDAATGRLKLVLTEHARGVISAVFDRSGAWVATASTDGDARIHDAVDGKLRHVLKGDGAGLRSVSFSADSRWLVTAGEDHMARVWDARTGQLISILKGHKGSIFLAQFSADGRWVLTASADGTARIFDATSGEVHAVLSGHDGPLLGAAFSPDGTKVVTAGHDFTARVWEAGTGKVLGVLQGHGGPVFSAAFSSDSQRVVTTSADRTARVWEKWHWAPLSEQFARWTAGQVLTSDERRLYLGLDEVGCGN